jgi:hypothetical protein
MANVMGVNAIVFIGDRFPPEKTPGRESNLAALASMARRGGSSSAPRGRVEETGPVRPGPESRSVMIARN